MNLDVNPKPDQLRDLLAQCDDAAGGHILWVKKSGDVEIATVPASQSLAGFQEAHPDMQLRFETFLAGNEYVGPVAAADQEWILELFHSLTREWPKVKGKPQVAYVGLPDSLPVE